jgi:hypothetical protein
MSTGEKELKQLASASTGEKTMDANAEATRLLKEKLEKEGTQKAEKIVRGIVNGTITSVSGPTFLNIIAEGNAEFKEKMGRPMTYSEMRDLYG